MPKLAIKRRHRRQNIYRGEIMNVTAKHAKKTPPILTDVKYRI